MFRVLCCFCLFLCSVCLAESWKPLQIVGCGGSGTTYTTQYLQAGGLEVDHEIVGNYGYVGWPFVVGFYNWDGVVISGAKFEHTFHQVRNPLKVISTWLKLNINRPEWQFIRRSISEIRITDSHIVQCAKYWYYWNRRAEAMSEWTYQVESLDSVLGEFEYRLGVSLDREAMKSIPRNVNAWKGRSIPITWDFLKRSLPKELFQNIQTMAQRYGYPITDA